ncbi:MAG: class II aldolase/adducin family protein [bacterium]|nr:class II aldolase/adducin family protein [bacterium]
MSFLNEREEVAYFMRRLYEQRLTTTSGGNISFCIDDDKVLITPSALDKGRISAEQIGVLTLSGENLTPHLKPSIEAGMHLAIYRKRPDVRAVVHAHPVTATAFTVCQRQLNCCLVAESRAILGQPVFAPYALMGTPELAEIVADAVLQGDCILMANHGVLTVGGSLLQAFDRIEVLEAAARLTIMTELLGSVKELSPAELAAIDALVGR